MKKLIVILTYFHIVLFIFLSSLLNSFGQVSTTCVVLSDAFITEEAPDNNFGAGSLLIGKQTNGERYAPLIKFDLSSIPSGATITNATMTLTYHTSFTQDIVNGVAYRITNSWVENSVTWGDVSYDNSVGGTITTSNGPSTITITCYTVVKKWIEDGYTNYGFILMPTEGSIDYNSAAFYSKEDLSSLEPTLLVYYTMPTPDITVQNPSVTPTTVCAGGTINVSCDHYCTDGSDETPNVGYYLSTNTTCTTSDTYLGDDGSSICGSDPYDVESETVIIPEETSPGTYYVCFLGDYLDEVSETNESNNCEYIQITVNSPQPTAQFSASSTNIVEGDCINFTDQSANSPTSWSWTFTGAIPTSSTSQNPSNICYSTAGSYQVSLTATNSCGSDTETKTSYITVTESSLPVADFTASSTSIFENDCIDFTDLTTNSPANWSWTFSGGSPGSSTSQNPSNICYSTAGTYQVSLTATSSDGSDTETKSSYITVTESSQPVADFTVSSTSIFENDCINFTDLTDNSPTSWSWTFSGASPGFSTLQNPSNICYSTAGTYQVSLTATNPEGSDTDTKTSYITVNSSLPPVSDFTVSSTSICENDCINFTDLTDNSPTSWSWTFSGASPGYSTLQNPSNICYSTAGTYQVSLTATNLNGSDTETKTLYITVNPPPIITITGDNPVCSGTEKMYNTDNNVDHTYLWIVNGGSIISGQNTSQVNIEWGDLAQGTISLTETINSTGCSASEDSVITINPTPAIQSIFGENNACIYSTLTYGIVNDENSLLWQADGGIVDNETQKITNIYWEQTGENEIRLTETNSFGCAVESILTVNVADKTLLDVPEIKIKFGSLLIGTNLLNAFASYQWYNEEGLISSATEQFYDAPLPLSGEYYLIATDNNTCKAESNHLVFDGSKSYGSILVYPNPVSEELSIQFLEQGYVDVNIKLYSSLGQVGIIKTIDNRDYLKKINTADLSEGIYFLNIECKGEIIYSEKIIIQH